MRIDLQPEDGENCRNIASALSFAQQQSNKHTTICLNGGVYRISRDEAIEVPYHISNTTSEEEDADVTKHIAVLLKGIDDITIDGVGAKLLLNGEMTCFVIDSCRNISLKNLCIDNEAPTQVEFTVLEDGVDYMVVQVHPTSHYRIENEVLSWYGKGWEFSTGIAQMFDAETNTTWRSWSPTQDLLSAKETSPGIICMEYKEKPEVKPGITFQLRDSYRDEVCGFINRSQNIEMQNLSLYFLGNFGIVGQYSENITVGNCSFAPEKASGRTNAGYADFLQISGCKGLVNIHDSQFTGAHDDPINIHGTHLKIVEQPSDTTLKVRFMHPQTYGFAAFATGDTIEIVDAHSLNPIMSNRVTATAMISPREILLSLATPITQDLLQEEFVVENITWTPRVKISNNTFSRIPTRGILITTRREAIIENNKFYNIPMPSILIADDALSWYESGAVHNLVIRNNHFYNCAYPIIAIAPENKKVLSPVHGNIHICDNVFESGNSDNSQSVIVKARSTENLSIFGNTIIVAPSHKSDVKNCDSLFSTEHCTWVSIDDNHINSMQ